MLIKKISGNLLHWRVTKKPAFRAAGVAVCLKFEESSPLKPDWACPEKRAVSKIASAKATCSSSSGYTGELSVWGFRREKARGELEHYGVPLYRAAGGTERKSSKCSSIEHSRIQFLCESSTTSSSVRVVCF